MRWIDERSDYPVFWQAIASFHSCTSQTNSRGADFAGKAKPAELLPEILWQKVQDLLSRRKEVILARASEAERPSAARTSLESVKSFSRTHIIPLESGAEDEPSLGRKGSHSCRFRRGPWKNAPNARTFPALCPGRVPLSAAAERGYVQAAATKLSSRTEMGSGARSFPLRSSLRGEGRAARRAFARLLRNETVFAYACPQRQFLRTRYIAPFQGRCCGALCESRLLVGGTQRGCLPDLQHPRLRWGLWLSQGRAR